MLTKENVLCNEPTVYNGSSVTCPTNASNPKPGDACHTLTDDNRNYVVAIESHPKDSHYQVISPETNQTIPSIMCHDAAHGGLIMEKRVFDSHRAHEFKEYTEVCESVLAHYGTGGGNTPMVLENREPVLLESNQDHATIREDGISTSLVASAGEGGGYVPMITQGINGDTAGTLDSNYFKGCGEREGMEREVVACGKVAACLNAQDGRGGVHSQKMADPEGNFVLEPKIIENGQTAQMGMHDQQAVMENLVVRRLTPLECSRLQGLPDGWLDIGEWKDEKGKLHKDSDAPKYKCAGNGIATPFWYWLMKRISKQLKADGVETPTMASLFDGSGSFPLLWQYINGDRTATWSSEIESYPIAVSERHLGENGDWQKFEKPKCLKVIDNDPTT